MDSGCLWKSLNGIYLKEMDKRGEEEGEEEGRKQWEEEREESRRNLT